MSDLTSIFIIGGSAGAKIATNIFKLTHPNCSIHYIECYSDEIRINRINSSLKDSLEYLSIPYNGYFIATGDNKLRKEHYELISNHTKKEPLNCIHPSSIVETPHVGYGNLICPNSVLHIDSKIGTCNIINTSSIVEHDCVIGNFSQISPNVTLCGYVTVGDNCFIGASATIIPRIGIKNNSTIAAGSVVINDVPSDVMVAGVPSQIKKHYNNEKI